MMVVFRSCAMLAIVSAMAAGQQGRRPPTPPAPPAPPTPVTPAPAPRARPLPPLDRAYYVDLERLRAMDTEEIRRNAAQASREALEATRIISREAMENAREHTRAALEAAQIAPQAYAASRDAMGQINALTPIPMQHLAPGVYSMAGQVGYAPGLNKFGPFDQADPADSLYRRATQLLDSYDYRAAAQRFKELQQKYPTSSYVSRAMYFQAFALYRSDTDAELREALSLLDQFLQKYPNARFQGENGYQADAPGLAQRIRGTLARRGDAAAARQVSQAAGSSASCDREDLSVKQEALGALWRINPAEAGPKFEQVLARRDECSLGLRRFALQTVTQRGDEKAVALLLATAKSDPSTQMRADAVSFVARFPNDEVLTALEQIARTEENDNIKRTAARNLVGYPSPRARQIVRTFIEDNTMSDGLRCDILSRFNNERGSADDATWLRASYTKITSPQVRRCMVSAVGNIGGAENQKWLMDLSANEQESSSIRAEAFRRSATNMSIADLSRQYDNAGNRNLRTSVIRLLNQRKEPEALDKLIDIVKKTSDVEVRREVIQMLSNRKDEKATKALMDLIDR